MKIKAMVFSCLIGAVVLFFVHEYSWAAPELDKPALKVGIVSILKTFQNCKKNEKRRAELVAERNKIDAELDKLSKQLEAEQAGLKTLKTRSDDYMVQVKEILEKRATYEARKEYYRQQMALKQQMWTEQLYKDILRIAKEIAKQKGLDLVLASDEPELPAPSYDGLMTMMSTHKVLYSGGCVDISDEVIGRLDAQE